MSEQQMNGEGQHEKLEIQKGKYHSAICELIFTK